MKIASYIMIHCIADNSIDITLLSKKIELLIRKYFCDAIIILKANKSYWKEPQSSSIIYRIPKNESIKILNLFTLIPISWEYSEGYAFNVDIQKRVDTENAIWSQLCHPEEIFLMQEVKWCHIYTLEEIENSIIH